MSYSMEIIRFIKITADECWAYATVDVLFGQIDWGYTSRYSVGYTIDGEWSIKEHVAVNCVLYAGYANVLQILEVMLQFNLWV